MFRVAVLFIILTVKNIHSVSTVVEISSGPIDGRYVTDSKSVKPYFAFEGIPYAEPPVGKLRFQSPVKPKPWNSTFVTKKRGPFCYQRDTGSEDCLYLNVFTPTLPVQGKNNTLLPVIVDIHGGGFVHGSASKLEYGPDYLIEKDVVLVTFNYRLNVFGFLNTFDEAVPGNAGLKDSLAVLHWVKDNIEKFSGNSNLVTISGHSAGSAAVQYVLQCKLAEGLFHRAISLSGSTLNPFCLQKDPRSFAFKLGTALNLTTQNSTELLHHLQGVTAEELFNASISPSVADLGKEQFVPSIEHDSIQGFVSAPSYELLNDNNIIPVPYLLGYVTNEALFFLPMLTEEEINRYNTHPEQLIPKSIDLKNDTEKTKLAADDIMKFFFKNGTVAINEEYLKYSSQNVFIRGIRKSVELMRNGQNDIYLYVFSYERSPPSEYSGVPHAEDLSYLFSNWSTSESETDKIIRQKMTTLVTNFARTGNPTTFTDPLLDNILWPKVSKERGSDVEYIDINNTLKIKKNPDEVQFKFWEKFFEKYSEPPYYTW